MHVDLADHGAAHDREAREGERQVSCADRHAGFAGRIHDAVADGNAHRVGLYLVGNDLYRSDNGVLDDDARARVDDFEAGLVGTVGLAVAVQSPAGYQRAMANLHIAEITLRIALRIAAIRPGALHAAAGDDAA